MNKTRSSDFLSTPDGIQSAGVHSDDIKSEVFPPPVPVLSIRNLVRIRSGRRILDNFRLEVASGGHLSICGPSGCGKSTLLRAIAGLDMPEAGQIAVNGFVVSSSGTWVPPHRRNIGFVFQTPALWPHMTIAENIRFGLHDMGKQQAEDRVQYLLARFSIAGLQHRRSGDVSGGEARRASIARSMAPRPALLLLDEPMAHLDEELKDDALDFLTEEAETSGTTLLFVTHDASEARRISPRCLRFTDGTWLLSSTGKVW